MRPDARSASPSSASGWSTPDRSTRIEALATTTLYDHAGGAPALLAFARAHQVFLHVAGVARTASGPRGWEWTASRARDLVARAGGRTVASCNITRSGPVVGVTNLDAPGVDAAAAWVEAGAAVAGLAPHAPVVAWSPAAGVAAAVAAGCVVTGPMRVWSR